jgi:hypothetical protein
MINNKVQEFNLPLLLKLIIRIRKIKISIKQKIQDKMNQLKAVNQTGNL